MKHKILLIDNDSGRRLGSVSFLSQKGYAVSATGNPAHAKEDILAGRFDALILGIDRRDAKSTAFIKGIRVHDPYLPIVVITGCEEIEIAVDAVRCGADNVLAEPVDLAALHASLETLLAGDRALPLPVDGQPKQRAQENFFGTGPAARRFRDLATAAAAGETPVLIAGETGTGKGMLANWLHQNGSRAQLFVAGLNCSGLRCDLLEAELFGAGRATASGKARSNTGLIKRAAGGTLILDEIGDMDLTVQARVLAALRAGTQQPHGTGSGAGFHLICTSNQRLDALARAGSFLPELLSCISATVLKIPPLRERLAELPGIVRHLLDGLRGPDVQITDEAMRVLKGCRWPGNLRELKNALEQGLIISHGARLRPEHFHWLKPSSRAREGRPPLTMSELKEQHIAAALRHSSGDVNEVATGLGISRTTMYRRLKELRGKNY